MSDRATPVRRMLVVASTFPADLADPVPAFVRDQVVAMSTVRDDLEIVVLAPHDRYTRTRDHVEHERFVERRFHYAWPHSLESLTGRGILPALREKPARYALVPALFVGEFVALLRLVCRERPDVVYAHWFTPQGLTAAAVSVLTGTPFVLTTHAADVDVWRKVPVLGTLLVRWAIGKADAVTAVSRRSMAKLEAFLPGGRSPRCPSAVIPMGVSLDVPGTTAGPDALREELGLGDAPVLLFIGRLAEKKGVGYLLRALARPGAVPGTRLLVAGDGPLRAELERESRELGLEGRVSFLGYTTGTRKADLLDLADVVVLPSIITDDGDAEGLPVVLMEALAHGRLSVATDVSGADDVLVDGRDGFLVPQRDETALLTALERALALTSEERRAVQRAARETAQSFDSAEIARRHLDFFDSSLARKAE